MILYCFLFLISYGDAFGRQESKLKVTDFYECEEGKNKMEFTDIVMRNVDNDGYKDFSANIRIPSDLTSDWQYQMRVDKLNNGDWQVDVYSKEGGFCEDLKKYFPGVWKKITTELDPPISEECFAKKDNYKLSNLEILKDEYTIPAVVYESIKVMTTVFDSSGEQVFCGIFEANMDS